MVYPILNAFLLRSLFIACILSAVSVTAYGRNTKAHIFYRIACQNNSAACNGTFETAEDAYAAYQADVNSVPNPPYIFFDMYPAEQSVYYDEKANSYLFHYQLANSQDKTIYSGSFLGMDMECRNPSLLTARTLVEGKSYHPYCYGSDQNAEPGPKACGVGNPIHPSTGNKLQIETDYRGDGGNGLRFVRTYRSDRNGWAHNYQAFAIDLTASSTSNNSLPTGACSVNVGSVTKQSYCFPYDTNEQTNDLILQRANGRKLNFGTASGLGPTTPDIDDRVIKTANGWTIYTDSNTVEQYDTTGRLTSSRDRNGQLLNFNYSDNSTSASIAPRAGLLIRVTDAFGRQLNFTYNAQSRMNTMTDPSGSQTIYAYDEASSTVVSGSNPVGNLTSVTYPDGKKRLYWYNEQDKTTGTDLPYTLTGITDENGTRFAIFKYDATGRAISTEYANSAQKYSITYDQPEVQSTVIDPLGTARTYNYQILFGAVRDNGQTQPIGPSASCPASASSITYDTNANIQSRKNFNGNTTMYGYDLIRNLETSRTEAFQTPQERTISTAWHSYWRLPIKVAEPRKRTTYVYNGDTYNGSVVSCAPAGAMVGNQPIGVLCKRIEQATTDANGSQGFNAALDNSVVTRTWSYTYNNTGQVLTVTSPRTDILDQTTYVYDPQGNLTSATNAVGHITTLGNYDANGRVGTITDPKDIVTTLTYWPRGWLKTRSVALGSLTELTSYDYDNAGQLKKVTLPDASFLQYTYDDAHRLIDVTDNLGNTIHYTPDAMGNHVKEEAKDPNHVLRRQIIRVIDALNRPYQITGSKQ